MYTLDRQGGKTFILPGLVYRLAGIFPAVCHLAGGNPESSHIVLKCSPNLWILQDPVLIFLPLHRESGRTLHDTLKLGHFTHNSVSVLNPRGKHWWFC